MSSLYFFLTSPSLSMVIKVMLIPYLYQYSSYYVLYIFRILVFRKSLLKDVVFRGCIPRSEKIPSGTMKLSVKPDLSKRAISRFVSYVIRYYARYYGQSHLYTHRSIFFSLVIAYSRMNIVMQNSSTEYFRNTWTDFKNERGKFISIL